MSKRTFTKEEKMSILKEESEQGVTITLEKYAIYLKFQNASIFLLFYLS